MGTPDYPLLTVPGYELYQLAHLTTVAVDALARHRRAANGREHPDRHGAAAQTRSDAADRGPTPVNELDPLARTPLLRWLRPPGRMPLCPLLTLLSSAVEQSSWPVWANSPSPRWPNSSRSASRACGTGWPRPTPMTRAAIPG